jgi:hypothetical protein
VRRTFFPIFFAVVAGCAAPLPPKAVAPGPALAPRSEGRDASEDAPSSAAIARRIEKWESGLDSGWEIGRRKTAGAFAAVVAHRTDNERYGEETGIIATEEGAIEKMPWSKIVSSDRDVDGDGRPDLFILHDARATPKADAHLSFAVIANRRGGPIVLPVEGALPTRWARIGWAGDEPAIELRVTEPGWGGQVLAWNGQALAPKDTTIVDFEADLGPHQWAPNWTMTAIAAGKTVGTTFSSSNLNSITNGDLLELAGKDGPKFYLLSVYQMPGPQEEGTQSTYALALDQSGWSEVDASGIRLEGMQDRDGNGVPELERSLDSIALARCAPKAADCVEELNPRVWFTTLASWDGSTFASQTPNLRAAHAKWLAEARKEVEAARTAKPEETCPLDLVRLWTRVYIGTRWAGAPDAKALRDADEVMKGYPTKPCEGSMTQATPWASVRKVILPMLKTALPR